MEKNTIFDEEIIFFDAEIMDDDDDAPVGTLVVRPEAPATEATTDETADEVSVADETVEEAAPAIDETPAPAVDEVIAAPIAEEKVAPQPAPKKARAPKAETPVEDKPVHVNTSKNVLGDSFGQGSMDMSYDYKIDLAPAPQPEPKKKAPAKPKTAPVKKEVTEADIWGTASIAPKKKAPTAPEAVEEPAPKKAPKAAPAPKKAVKKVEPEAEKPAPKKAAPKKVKAEPEVQVAEETPVETVAPAPVKKTRKKADPKPDANDVEIKNTNEEENKVAKETTKAAATPEQILVEGTGQYHGKFVIKKTDKGHFVYKLFAYGNKCVAIGAQAYESLSGVKGGIASVSRIAATSPIENQTLKSYETLKFPKWEIYADKKGEFRLRLYAANGNLVATTNDGYLSVSAAKKGIESVARAAEGAAIVRNDNLW